MILFLGIKTYDDGSKAKVLYKINPNTFTIKEFEVYDNGMDWYRQIGSFPYAQGGSIHLSDVKLDNDENIYIIGEGASYGNPVSYPMNSFSLPLNPKLTAYDHPTISKFNKDGDLLWAKYFGGNTTSRSQSQVEIDANNNTIVGTGFWHEAIFDSIFIDENHKLGIGFAKYSPDGVQQWATYKYARYSDFLALLDISLDEEGNTYFLAQLSDGEFRWDSYTLESQNDNHLIFLGKLSSSGQLQWIETVSDSTQWRIGHLKTYENSIIISLSQRRSSPYLSGCYGYQHLNNLYKYTSEGKNIWEKNIESSDLSFISSIDINAQGTIYIVGNYVGSLDFNDRKIDFDKIGDCEKYNWFLAKISQNGQILQAHTNPDKQLLLKKIYCEAENYYLTGVEYFEDGAIYDGYSQFADDAKRIFIEEYDYVNNLLGKRSFNKSYGESNPHLAIFNDNKILLVDTDNFTLDTLAYFTSTVDYDESIMLHKFTWENNQLPINVDPDEADLTLKLAPNPSNGVTTVKIIDEIFENFELTIFDMSGKMVHFHRKEDNFDYEVF